MKKTLFIFLQYLIPQHIISRFAGSIASSENPWIKNFIIKRFIDHYSVNMNEAKLSNEEDFLSFNDFFCRELQDNARPISKNPKGICSPADGLISQLGTIKNDRIFQAKGQSFNTTELLGGNHKLSAQFNDGEFATIYLSPKDYHRVHMPITGRLTSMVHIPGDLFSVNPTTAENVPRLFARNERLACIFETETGPVAVILVGAMIVASIETIWSGQVAPAGKKVSTTQYGQTVTIEKGKEMGRFKLGSTVVLLFPKDTLRWSETLAAGTAIKMGQEIAQFF